MFTVKHAIMEILNKSKTLDEALAALDTEDQATLIATFDLMKAKLGGSMDTMDLQDNGQWSLAKNTIDYSKINAPKASDDSAPTLDYSKMSAPRTSDKPKPWDGAVARRDAARRDAARAKNQKWVDDGAKGSGETDDKNALAAIRDRRAANKSEDQPAEKSEGKQDRLQQIKNQHAGKQPKPLSEEIAEAKKRNMPKPPKTDEEKANEAKDKFRQEQKLKAEEPFKNGVKASKRQTLSELKS